MRGLVVRLLELPNVKHYTFVGKAKEPKVKQKDIRKIENAKKRVFKNRT